ncbi:ski oncogene isoform X2 [Sitophilus oryzae]|uniref:Ski oncogene isoform X2 n=1 Tax=Sitophilus oryzae TaxID=7048 RepID=A0A6J2X314_SITOR|nr:ski oncogene isoform X2 [Sitophilus oryzae]
MMEVTPHLKTVLKNYQYSATKSLQGPGLSLNPSPIKNEVPPSPEGTNNDEDFQPSPVPFPVQQVPILAAPDTSCSERSETILEGEAISCFVVGGEKRLCLPQVLNSVLREFTLQEINRECDQLQIYCSRCTPEQLNVLKSHAILPSGAPSCGLITKTDAERLCSALLFGAHKNNQPLRPRKGATSFPVYHECFGEARGRCYPELFTGKHTKCIECSDCQGGFNPQQFVCHVHRNLENRTVHWGFDSSSHWRSYLHVPDEESDKDNWEKILDEMLERYLGKIPFPPPPVVESTVKRKQIPATDVVKDHQATLSDLPLKKQKLDEYLGNLGRVPPFALPAAAAAAIMQQQIYSALEPVYIHRCLQEFNVRSHLSAFKPVTQSIREQKLRSANALGLAARCTADPPLLQNPDRVVPISESERSYQPNVALAPPTPKKHRYGKIHETQSNRTSPPVEKADIPTLDPPSQSSLTNGHHHVKEETEVVNTPPSDKGVSVVQMNNPEIELSTDTEDSASETSDKHTPNHVKLEEALKAVKDEDVRDKIMELFRNVAKERERAVFEIHSKDQSRIEDLERENAELRKELEQLRQRISEEAKSESVSSSSIIVQSTEEPPSAPTPVPQSVIATVASVQNGVEAQEVIKNTAPE